MINLDITVDPQRIDAVAAHAFLTTSYWALGIPIDVVRKAIQNSLCVASFIGERQIAFARLVTDRATFAYLADVYVLPEHRGKGISKCMLESLFAHPEVKGLRRIMLATNGAHGLYAKFGFVPLPMPEIFMERHNRAAYALAGSGG